MARRPPGRNGDRRRHARAERGQVVRLPVGRFGVMLRAGIEGKENAMLRRVAVAAIVVVDLVAPALADEEGKRNAMHHIASVLAVTKLCPSVEADITNLTLVGVSQGIELGPDSSEGRMIAADANYQIESMKDTPVEQICMSALLLYGEDGLNVPGLLREK